MSGRQGNNRSLGIGGFRVDRPSTADRVVPMPSSTGSMTALLQAVTEARQQRSNAEQSFRAALVRAKEVHSWAEIARAAGVSKSGARWLVRSTQTLEEER